MGESARLSALVGVAAISPVTERVVVPLRTHLHPSLSRILRSQARVAHPLCNRSRARDNISRKPRSPPPIKGRRGAHTQNLRKQPGKAYPRNSFLRWILFIHIYFIYFNSFCDIRFGQLPFFGQRSYYRLRNVIAIDLEELAQISTRIGASVTIGA